jgi:hypothetical protein
MLIEAVVIKARIFIREDYEKTLFYPLKFISGFQDNEISKSTFVGQAQQMGG